MPDLELIPLTTTPAVTVDDIAPSKTYAVSVRRIFKTMEDRCFATDREPKLKEVGIQLAIRMAVLERPSGIKELCAMRDLIKAMRVLQDSYDEAGFIVQPCDLLPKSIELPEWLYFASWRQFDRLAERITLATYREYKSFGCSKLQALVEEAKQFDSFNDSFARDDLIADSLAGRKRARARRSPKIDWEPISALEFESMLDQLPAGAEIDGLNSLRRGKAANLGGVARIMARAAWLTGMRALEVFQCRLLKINPGENLALPGAGTILDDLRAADECKLLHDADFGLLGEDLGHDGQAPLILRIRTLKTANASPLINNAYRFQILRGIDQRDISALAFASMLGRLDIPRTRAEGIATRCSTHLGAASLRADPTRKHTVTLHTLRHAFIDAARRTLPPHEIAALSGHTSRQTMLGYGGKHARWSRKSGSTRWMPQADPASAKAIKKAWLLRIAKKAKPDPESELIPEPHFH